MKVLLTGANGFVGSHVLDSLQARGVPTAILLRSSADTSFIQQHLASVEVRAGSISHLESVQAATSGITHVIHCAGLTKARSAAEFYDINQGGTRNMVLATNAQPGIQRFVHVSSLAAAGPANATNPAREDDAPHPVSTYGKSKLAGETEVRQTCRTDFAIIRPPAVYGPRDRAFLSLFKAISSHLLPRTNAGQALSLVFVKDLAEAIVTCLAHPNATRKTYFAAAPEVTNAREMAEVIAAQLGKWTLPLPLPPALLWPVCLFQECLSHLTGKASIVNLQKFAELRAPGWVCNASLLKQDTGFECGVRMNEGIARTVAWYREHKWL